MTERFLRLPQVIEIVGLQKTEIYARIKKGEFPRQRRQSHKVSVWYASEIDEWVKQQMQADA